MLFTFYFIYVTKQIFKLRVKNFKVKKNIILLYKLINTFDISIIFSPNIFSISMDTEDSRSVKLIYMDAKFGLQLGANWTIEHLINQLKTNPFFNENLKKNHPRPQTYSPIQVGDQVNIYRDQDDEKLPLTLTLSRYKPKKQLVFTIKTNKIIKNKQKESEFQYNSSVGSQKSSPSKSIRIIPKKQVDITPSKYTVRLDENGRKYVFELTQFKTFKDLSNYIKNQQGKSQNVKIHYYKEQTNQKLPFQQYDEIEKMLPIFGVSSLRAHIQYDAGS